MKKICEKPPKVSIVILTYQKFDGVYRTLDTVLTQTYKNIEIIISDDGSERFPEDEITLWTEKKCLTCVKIRRNESNLGVVAHANTAASYCTGEYIKFLPPGDGFCSPNSLDVLVEAALHCNAQILTSPAFVYRTNYEDVRYIFPSKRRIKILKMHTPVQLFSMICVANTISAVGTIYHHSFFENGGFDEEYRHLDDWPTWLSYLRNKGKIEIYEKPTVYYGLDGMSNCEGTAFESEVLKRDLIHCYEKEILPYRRNLSFFARWYVNYRYKKLIGEITLPFGAVYFPFELYSALKRRLKQIVMSSSLFRRGC